MKKKASVIDSSHKKSSASLRNKRDTDFSREAPLDTVQLDPLELQFQPRRCGASGFFMP